MSRFIAALPMSSELSIRYSVRDAAGDSVKSAISHTFIHDSRDDPFVATKGSYLKLRQVRFSRSPRTSSY